jgi:hypothetical protein
MPQLQQVINMEENKIDDKMASRAQQIICITLVAIWILLSSTMLYLLKEGKVTEGLTHIVVATGLLVVMINDLILGLYFDEYPSAYGNIKKYRYPKSYLVRTIFDSAFVIVLILFLLNNWRLFR